MPEFNEIVRDLKKARDENKLETDDNTLFDAAVRMHISMMINESQQRPKIKNKNEDPMTERQRILLERLDYKGPMNLSKNKAREVIRQQLEK